MGGKERHYEKKHVSGIYGRLELEKIKEGAEENKAVWNCMYAAFVMMFSMSASIAGENFQLTDALLSIGMFLPICIVMVSVMEHPIRLRKMRYLCPQTEGERARSVRLTYYFRVGIHMIIFLMGLLLLFSVGFFTGKVWYFCCSMILC